MEAVDLIQEKSTVQTNHRLIAWLHQVNHYLPGIKKYVVSSASPKSKSGKSPLSLSIGKIFAGLFYSPVLILTMPSLEKQLITWWCHWFVLMKGGKYTSVNWIELRFILGWTYPWINSSIMKSICFLFSIKRAIISSTATTDMKFIIVLC